MPSTEKPEQPSPDQHIKIVKHGPYRISGKIPLKRYSQIMSDKFEPLAWEELDRASPQEETYLLCRCGLSEDKPFCDGKHTEIKFEGTETARTDGSRLRSMTYRAKDGFNVTKIIPLCMSSGFCVTVNTTIDELVELGNNETDRKTAIKMVEDCPAGSLVYRLTPDGEIVEPNLPPQIAETFEGTFYGSIRGPLWVMGEIPIERADGVPFVPRNRVTLCCCGMSSNKPLCDGTHRKLEDMKHHKRK